MTLSTTAVYTVVVVRRSGTVNRLDVVGQVFHKMKPKISRSMYMRNLPSVGGCKSHAPGDCTALDACSTLIALFVISRRKNKRKRKETERL